MPFYICSIKIPFSYCISNSSNLNQVTSQIKCFKRLWTLERLSFVIYLSISKLIHIDLLYNCIYPLSVKNVGMHDGDKVGDKPKLNPEEMLYKIVDCIMPKLQCADYYTVPRMEELISKEKEEAGFLLPREGLCGRKTWVWKHQVLGRNRCPEA